MAPRRRHAIRHGQARKGYWHMANTIASGVGIATAHDWWTPEGSKRILSGDRYVKEIEATTPVVQ
jgi:hypothetical protein